MDQRYNNDYYRVEAAYRSRLFIGFVFSSISSTPNIVLLLLGASGNAGVQEGREL